MTKSVEKVTGPAAPDYLPPLKADGRRSPVVSCSAAEDMARQEYALQSDLSYQIQRFGVGHHGVAGVVDFDNMDLTRAMELVEQSNQAWLSLPAPVRARYGSWHNVQKAAESGELQQMLKAAGVAEVPSDAAGASASDSAPEGSPKAS